MEKLYRIALGMVSGVGNIGAKNLIEAAGSAKAVFELDHSQLIKIEGVGSWRAKQILDKSVIEKARREIEYIRKNGIHCFFLGDENYPHSLSNCYDAPSILYTRGNLDLQGRKVLSVVGTRRPSFNGLEACRQLIINLGERHPDLVIVSGLAYGIDHCAHQTALDEGLKTVAVLAHGLKYMYPAIHRGMAAKIEASGALITDFNSDEKPEKNNFIKRNRIIAGLSKATVVVESGSKGGALVTADLANSYDRDVFAFPGRISDPSSSGCNRLIKSNRAVLIESYKDIEYILGWEPITDRNEGNQKSLLRDLGPEETKVLEVLQDEGDFSIDFISLKTHIPVSKVSAILLVLELEGYIRVLPGDSYKRIV